MTDGETTLIEVSPEEEAVIHAMRAGQRNGKAIFKYAMKYESGVEVDHRKPPWRQRPLASEQ